MKKTIYTICDHVSQTYWHPFFCFNDQDAKRSVSHIVNTPSDNDLYLHPSDFELLAIGTFDDQVHETIIDVANPIIHICRCDSLVAPPASVQDVTI